MVCTSQPLATQAGVDVLRAGGNAIDAALCANAVLGVTEPASCGIGGDLFAMVWMEEERKLFGLNASGRAPFDWSLDAALALNLHTIPTFGPFSWTVPGCVSGWQALLDRFGRRKLSELLAPAINYARGGFPVAPVHAQFWSSIDGAEYPTWGRTYAPEGRAPRFGEMFANPDLADALDRIAEGGADAFYQGDIAQRIVAFSRQQGGRFSLRDFEEHGIDWVEPVSSPYRGYDVWQLPLPGQGIAVLQILNILEQFDIQSLAPNSPEHLHLIVEAKKLVYEDRAAYYADPEFASVPVGALVSKAYAKKRAALIDPSRASNRTGAGQPGAGKDTVYLCTADRDGNMVSLIQSIFHGFGSREVPDGLGFALQNRGAGFSLDPEHPNRLEPNKRPFHTIIPGFVTQSGRPLFALGVTGGDFQPQGQVQILMNVLDFGMSVQEAGEQPRVCHEGSSDPSGAKGQGGGEVICEPGISTQTRARLTRAGHEVRPGTEVFGGYQGLWRQEDPRRYSGGSDPRKDGCAAGF